MANFKDDIVLNKDFKKYINGPDDIVSTKKWVEKLGMGSLVLGAFPLYKYLDMLIFTDTVKKIENYCETISPDEAREKLWNILYDAVSITNNRGDVAIFSDMAKESYRVHAFGAERSDFAINWINRSTRGVRNIIKINEINSEELVIEDIDSNEKYHIEACLDEYGHPFIAYGKIFNIQVTRAEPSMWYANKIGEVFEVYELFDCYSVIGYPGVILKEDAKYA